LAVEGVFGTSTAESDELLTRAEAQFAREHDDWGHAFFACVRTECFLKAGDETRALQIGRAAIDAFRALDDRWGLSAVLYHLGWGLRQFGRYAEAVAMLDEAIEVALSAELHNTAQWALADQGIAFLYLGEFHAASACFDRAREASEQIGD